jgi:hypothetical protein
MVHSSSQREGRCGSDLFKRINSSKADMPIGITHSSSQRWHHLRRYRPNRAKRGGGPPTDDSASIA